MTYRNEAVAALANEMVFVQLNAEIDSTLADHYGVPGYPTIIMTQSDGTEIDRIIGYAEPEEFIEIIRDYQADRNTLADYLRRVDTAASHELYYKIGDKFADREQFSEAEAYYRKILQEDPNNEDGYADSALYSIGSIKAQDKKYGAAEEIYTRFLNTYPESDLAQEVAVQIAHCQRRDEKYDQAVESYRAFLDKHPDSELATDIELYIALTYSQKGDGQTALGLFRKFLVDHPDSPDSSWVLKQIDKIENPPEEDEES